LTQHLASEKLKVKELENHLETQRGISRGLQEQISLLEQRIQSEEARSKEVKVCFVTFIICNEKQLMKLLYVYRY